MGLQADQFPVGEVGRVDLSHARAYKTIRTLNTAKHALATKGFLGNSASGNFGFSERELLLQAFCRADSASRYLHPATVLAMLAIHDSVSANSRSISSRCRYVLSSRSFKSRISPKRSFTVLHLVVHARP